MGTIKAVAEAIKEGMKVWYQWRSGSERRRMRAAIDAAEQYIFVNEKDGRYQELSENRRKKLLRTWRRRFFHYNN